MRKFIVFTAVFITSLCSCQNKTDSTGWEKDYPNETRLQQENRLKKLIKEKLPKIEIERVSNFKVIKDNKDTINLQFDYFVYANKISKNKSFYDGFFSINHNNNKLKYDFIKRINNKSGIIGEWESENKSKWKMSIYKNENNVLILRGGGIEYSSSKFEILKNGKRIYVETGYMPMNIVYNKSNDKISFNAEMWKRTN